MVRKRLNAVEELKKAIEEHKRHIALLEERNALSDAICKKQINILLSALHDAKTTPGVM
jgi:hypothetical protein